MTAHDAPFFIVMNAGSGRDDAHATRETVAGVMNEAGRAHRILLVEQPGDLQRNAREAVALAREHGGTVVAAGGDGTINAVTQQVLGSGRPLGVLPQGTFNYFCRTHGIPLETEAATRFLLTAEPQPVQVGLMNDKVFLVNASLGLYPRLLEDREAYKQQYGRSRLVALWSALVTLSQAHRPLRLELERAGQVHSIRTPTLFIGNNRLQFEQIGLQDGLCAGHGVLTGVTLRPIGTLAMLWLIVRGAFGTLGQADDVFSFTAERLTVRPSRKNLLALGGSYRFKGATDGEVAWVQAPVVFRVSPEPLWLLKPKAPER